MESEVARKRQFCTAAQVHVQLCIVTSVPYAIQATHQNVWFKFANIRASRIQIKLRAGVQIRARYSSGDDPHGCRKCSAGQAQAAVKAMKAKAEHTRKCDIEGKRQRQIYAGTSLRCEPRWPLYSCFDRLRSTLAEAGS